MILINIIAILTSPANSIRSIKDVTSQKQNYV